MASNKPVAIKSPRKLIEVALPLDKINDAAAREKSIRHGHPSTLHLWWARRPLAAARAILFAQLVNDPGFERQLNRGVNKVEAAKERERLFKIIEDLVIWENSNNEGVIAAAKNEILKSWRETCDLNRNHPDAATLFNPEELPAFHDPFAGGGALPLEALRLGMTSYASDLNPVAVTINKAMIEIPPLFAGRTPIGPLPEGEAAPSLTRTDWPGASGLAEDVRRYGIWMRSEAQKRIGHLYPHLDITTEMVSERPDLTPLLGQKLTVIAWIWARTVKSPNPAYSHVDVPLVSTFVIASKAGKEFYVQPIIEGDKYSFVVRVGVPPAEADAGTKASGRGADFRCIISDSPIDAEYIRKEGRAGRIGSRLLAIVAEAPRGRCYLSPTTQHEQASVAKIPMWSPKVEFFQQALGFRIGNYGFSTWSDLFTPRQLVALETLCNLLGEAREHCRVAESRLGLTTSGLSYADAVSVYLAFGIDRIAMTGNSLNRWNSTGEKAQHCFGRQTLSMLWDFAEPNPLADATGSISAANFYSYDPLPYLPTSIQGHVFQAAAQHQEISRNKVVSTDPPYYDNVGYADLSDFFYVWLRKNLRSSFPDLFGTMTTPKTEEIVATPGRHETKKDAESFFLEQMSSSLLSLSKQTHPAFPLTIYYAFKQSDTSKGGGVVSTGWETFLEAVIRSEWAIVGTWPVRTEMGTRQIAMNNNALASSIVIVCRKRSSDAGTISRREFLRELYSVLPDALVDMTRGGVNSPVAPVDLSQAIIGPGMGIFSKYKAVLEADGTPMSVRTALLLINRFLADDDFDSETRFCLQWLDGYGWKPADYGYADTLAQAKGAIVSHMNREGILTSGGGVVQLIRWQDLKSDWLPERHNLTPIWQALHQLMATLQAHGEQSTGALLAAMPAVSGRVRTLAYRLYTLAERKGLAEDARPYNELIGAWSAIELAAAEIGPIETQAELF